MTLNKPVPYSEQELIGLINKSIKRKITEDEKSRLTFALKSNIEHYLGGSG